MAKSQPENAVKNAILEWLALQKDCFAFPVYNGACFDGKQYRRFGKGRMPGISDIIAVWQGRPLAIECKAGKNRISEDQGRFLDRFAKAGGITIVAYNVQDVRDRLYGEKTH